MAGTMEGRRGGTIAAINVTPLVDVVLALLIILMVSSTYIVAQTLKVQLPKAKSADGTADKPHTVAVLKNGTLTWDEAPVNEDQAVKNMKDAVAADPEFSLVVSADKEVQHGK